MGAVLPCFTVAGLGCGLAFSPGLPCCAGAGLPCAFALPGCAAFVLAVLLFELDTLVVVLELLPVELGALDAFVLVDVVVPDVALVLGEVLVDELEVLVVGALVMLDQQLLEAAQGDVPAWLYSSRAAASCTDAGAEAAVV